jgi:8-oxo-dGTP pyrophosphatase MutT (NUDIX family)
MTGTIPDQLMFTERRIFLNKVIEKLGTHTCDFQEAFQRITSSGRTDHRRRAAGEDDRGGDFVLQVIKRSSVVAQPGDLSLPGGMLNPVLDRFLRILLIYGPFYILAGNAHLHVLRQSPESSRLITLFLSNALREAWEEIRLNPTRVRFLGPLPAYNLTFYQRTIFPLVGFVESPCDVCMNREVEKVLEIPLSYFEREDVYGIYRIIPSGRVCGTLPQYPCLIYTDSNGEKEILWGATFNIICKFLEIATSWRIPEWRKGPVIVRNVASDYMRGYL